MGRLHPALVVGQEQRRTLAFLGPMKEPREDVGELTQAFIKRITKFVKYSQEEKHFKIRSYFYLNRQVALIL